MPDIRRSARSATRQNAPRDFPLRRYATDYYARGSGGVYMANNNNNNMRSLIKIDVRSY